MVDWISVSSYKSEGKSEEVDPKKKSRRGSRVPSERRYAREYYDRTKRWLSAVERKQDVVDYGEWQVWPGEGREGDMCRLGKSRSLRGLSFCATPH